MLNYLIKSVSSVQYLISNFNYINFFLFSSNYFAADACLPQQKRTALLENIKKNFLGMTTTAVSSIPSSSSPMHFVEHPKSEWIRSRPAHFRCIAANAQRIRVKCNTKWLLLQEADVTNKNIKYLNDDRIFSERFTDSTNGEPLIRINVEIQRPELDAWFADLGEFACQCWAFSEQNFNEDFDSEEEDVDGANREKKTTSVQLKNVKTTIIRSDIAKIKLACKLYLVIFINGV
ncbi:hypothetical protein Mgra_00000825 [Meloidogyne graminicola]|uniref:Netrin receptor UNC5A-D-like N-terminal domain-containing protein n=1 Tax=Meloidogyne graminicola TaxID=189291 RepID=A0A8T0A1E8_9BILA|nr:hypothetical protein Mgra_00000825 [Meloidogyne graminicola]